MEGGDSLLRLNTRFVANSGLIGGGLTIIAAVAYFFNVLKDPTELVNLYVAIKTHGDPNGAIAKLVGAAIGVVGALTVALLAAYFGKPASVPQEPSK